MIHILYNNEIPHVINRVRNKLHMNYQRTAQMLCTNGINTTNDLHSYVFQMAAMKTFKLYSP